MSEKREAFDFADQMRKGLEIPCPSCTGPMPLGATQCPSCKTQFSADQVRANIANKKSNPAGCISLTAIAAAAVAGVVLLTSQCSSSSDPADLPFEQQRPYWEEAAKELIRERLREPQSAVFSELKVIDDGEDSATIVCGKVNSRNGFGGMTGPQRFISGGTVMLEEDFTPAQMDIAWTRFCS